MPEAKWNRRIFMQKSMVGTVAAGVAASSTRTVQGANERLRVGVIGCGSRGIGFHIPELIRLRESHNLEIVAVCDVWRQHREEAAQRVKDEFDNNVKLFDDYRDLLALKDIDAVTIASCDHQHSTMLAEAVEAGKDVYCEKPLAVNMKELVHAVDTVKSSDRVVQVGTQRRSEPWNVGARQVIQEGKIGKIIKVDLAWNAYKPYWHHYVRPVKESDTNWNLFLFNLKDRPFDEDQHCCWYGYRGFTSGPIGGWMSHLIDVTHFVTGCGCPGSAVTQGGIYTWKDQRTCPDSVHTVLEYPEGFLVSYETVFGNGFGHTMRFYGTKGVTDLAYYGDSELSGDGSEDPARLTERVKIPHIPVPGHFENWLQCIRSRQTPVADIDSGYKHAVACILSDEAMVHNKRMLYDDKRRKIIPGDKKSDWLDMNR